MKEIREGKRLKLEIPKDKQYNDEVKEIVFDVLASETEKLGIKDYEKIK